MGKYICIHGHFYQPPRENPWLEAIELQDSAYPYHDWNERINVECYVPNTASRILNSDGLITKLPNNYAKMSYNIGPTLLNWLEVNDPETYKNILLADRVSQKNFSGHGSALAQAYNHIIMPLANPQDKYTQVRWGIKDFEHRYGRTPEGMWLPETAVDVESLEIMAEAGITYSILAPYQAKRCRPLGSEEWRELEGGQIDPRQAYLVNLPSGRIINLFFYDGPLSRAVAFERLLSNGEGFAHRLLGAFPEDASGPQLVHIATDGESYGHHHPFGDMAMAYALSYIEANGLAHITNYGEFLEKYPPSQEVEIHENTSWSCAHGVERWWKNCGCNSGMRPGWNQGWRTPLRDSLDWLRNLLIPYYENLAGQFLNDPWAARNDYIEIILNRSPENVEGFINRHGLRTLSDREKITVLKLMEIQRHAMLMYTSCGWFFDELSGIETVQIIQYAGRVIQLAQEVFGTEIESLFLERLEAAKSNLPEHEDGRKIYEKFVKPAMVNLLKVGAHYAVSSLFEPYNPLDKIYCYSVKQEDYRSAEAGKGKLAVGHIQVDSAITNESLRLCFSVLHMGDHNLYGGVREFKGEEGFEETAREIMGAFAKADYPETIRMIDQHFGASTYSLRPIFRDKQRQVLNQIMEASLAEAHSAFGSIYNHYAPLMHFLKELGIPLPRPYHAAAEVILNHHIGQALRSEELDINAITGLFGDARDLQISLDAVGLEYVLRKTLERMSEKFREQPNNLESLIKLDTAVGLAQSLPCNINLWKVQNIYYELLHTIYPEFNWRSQAGEDAAEKWVGKFAELGKRLSMQVE